MMISKEEFVSKSSLNINKKILFSFLLFFLLGLVFGLKANAASYHVDCNAADDNGVGTSEGTAWKTIAKVNNSSFNHGDSVLFKKNCTWREQLTIPSSGSFGDPIIFGAYGTGSNPVFNGSTPKNNGDFSSHTVTPTADVFTETANTDFNNSASYNIREEFTADTIVFAVTKAKFTYCAQSNQDWVITGAGIGQQVADASGNLGQDTTSMTRITFSGGNNGITITANTCAESDTITLGSIDLRNAFVTSVFAATRYFKTTHAAHRMWFGGSGFGNQSQTADTSYTLPTSTYGFIRKITAVESNINIWKTSQMSDPREVWEGDTALTKQASIDACVNSGSWYWDGVNTLYTNATDGSDITTNGRDYEVGNLTENVNTNGKSYITLQDFTAKHTVGTVANVGGIQLTGDHIIAQRLTSYGHERHCLSHYRDTNSLIVDSVMYDSYSTTPITFWDSQGHDNVLRGSTVYNSVSNAGVIVMHGGSHNNTIEDCDLYGNYSGSNGHIFNLYDAGTTDLIIRRNNIHGKASRIVSAVNTNNVYLLNNTINMTSLGDAALVFDNSAGSTVYNNSLYWSSNKFVVSALTTTSNLKVKNNVAYTPLHISMIASANTGFESDYNNFYGGSATPLSWSGTSYNFSDWKNNSTQDAHSLSSNPEFVNSTDFNLQSTSPAINAGTNIDLTSDYNGNSIYGLPDIGAYEYQPPYTSGTNEIDVGAGARVYGDGKFENINATSGTTADLSVIPQESQTTKWLDITKADDELSLIWEANHKKWKESSTTLDATNTLHTVGDLEANKYYNVKVDSVLGQNISGSNCTSGVCLSNAQGKITFTYTGTYSEHTFDVAEGDNSAPVLSNLTPQGTTYAAGTDSVTLSLSTNENATCKYSMTAGAAFASMSGALETTGGTTHSFSSTNLADGNSYSFYVKCQDTTGNITASDQQLSFSISSSEYIPTLAVGNKKTYTLSPDTTISVKSKYVVFRGRMSNLNNGRVQVFQDGALKKQVKIKKSRKWSVRVNEGSRSALHTYQFKYYDQNIQLVETSQNFTVMIDRQKPKFTYLPKRMTMASGETISWQVSDNDQIKYYQYTFRGAKNNTINNSFTLPASLPKGKSKLTVRAYDRAGNKAVRRAWIIVR